jgi:hypothetical protein
MFIFTKGAKVANIWWQGAFVDTLILAAFDGRQLPHPSPAELLLHRANAELLLRAPKRARPNASGMCRLRDGLRLLATFAESIAQKLAGFPDCACALAIGVVAGHEVRRRRGVLAVPRDARRFDGAAELVDER